MQPKVTFVTVCYKTPNLIRLLLRGMEEAKFSFPFEYILVDNGRDGTLDMVRERFPWVKTVDPGSNLGFGKANNLAIGMAQGEYVMLINPDLTVFPGEIEKLVAFMDANPGVGLSGPCVESPNGARQCTCTRFPGLLIPAYKRTFLGRTPWGKRALSAYDMDDVPHHEPHDADALYGAAILARKRTLDEIGIFDERFFMYYEDLDLCRRSWEKGWRVSYVPQARVVHYHQRESMIRYPWQLLTNRLTRIHIASAVKYFLKYRNQPLPKTRVRSPERASA